MRSNGVPQLDFKVERGNTNEAKGIKLRDQAGNVFPSLADSEIIMTISARRLSVVLSTADGSMTKDLIDCSIGFILTPEQSRTIPLGKIAEHEIEMRIDGAQYTIFQGFVEGSGGLNND